MLGCVISLYGCDGNPSAPAPSEIGKAAQPSGEDHPIVTAPAFRVVHQAGTIVTLIIPEKTTDDQIVNLLWFLRDRAISSTLDSAGISQRLVDRRDPMVWFQIYRGTKCASENYSKHRPCGQAEHEAAWFGYGSVSNRNSNAGEIFHGPNETEPESVWDAGTPYSRKPYIKAPLLAR